MRRFGILIIVGILAGCVSSHVAKVPEPAVMASPQADKAVVVFMRPSSFGGAIQSSVYDVTDGQTSFISAGTKIAYSSDPGMRRFMVIGESADFMDADLLAGKAYYALVRVRMGAWKARFSLAPLLATSPELASYLNDTDWVENSPSASDWARANMSSVKAKQAEYLPNWLQKPDKPRLKAEDGRLSGRQRRA